jgi:SAM-dependent methyltransferase
MESSLSASDWEAMFAPYDQQTYQAVLDRLGSKDVILDIGAGDLRLSRQMARVVRKVYAVEINSPLLEEAQAVPDQLPANLVPICADARTLDFPSDVTAGVLLMRHCTCFRLYVEKLQKVGATHLITNARWRMDVETVNLLAQRKPFMDADMGWYACSCGGTGFKEASAERWTMEMDQIINEVSNCPKCMNAVLSRDIYVA